VREREYQAKLIKKLRREFPGVIILKNDSEYLPGVPDLLVLYGNRWAMLEVKVAPDASTRPNQEYYVDLFNEMSFGAFIHPFNEKEVLDELRRTFQGIQIPSSS